MADKLSPADRSRLMARVRSKNTKPEMAVRRMLHALGFRYRLHLRDLPGTPDIVLTRWKAVIQVNGCFFHGHKCPAAGLPATNRDFWRAKILRNQARDLETTQSLIDRGWRVMTVWECALKGSKKLSVETLEQTMAEFVKGDIPVASLSGREPTS
ncbi:very short patch repair endonuclease [Rhizobium ruizarguesonis]